MEAGRLVDLDKEVTLLFKQNSMLLQLNKSALLSPKVRVVNADAFQWLKQQHTPYDVVIVDFPAPSNYAVGKLYTTTFYKQLRSVLHEESIVVIQSTSPYVAPRSFWCVNNTLHTGLPAAGVGGTYRWQCCLWRAECDGIRVFPRLNAAGGIYC
ncbi:hypothetical protein KTO58_25845 [Chitinophaga pendula]|uniref:spermine/spermidine synthase domain-containing protein n=1 Tax=Chitinophaga TaxID=79328 RepID=UPI000BAF878E|nr:MULTISPECIES: hypothetical protein [Chitinophaga]ASZ10006.1 hypothetical protein CK934_02935 [Chitinophaga sp. MD30]UCJ07050.1 hypothetical protein KTO58_25845 [Chitinophaga pendula]